MDELAHLYSDVYFNVKHFDPHALLSVVLEYPDGSIQSFSVQTAYDGTLGTPMPVPGQYITAYGQYALKIEGACRGQHVALSKDFTVI